MTNTSARILLEDAPVGWHDLPAYLAALTPEHAAAVGVAAVIDLYTESVAAGEDVGTRVLAVSLAVLRDRLLGREVNARLISVAEPHADRVGPPRERKSQKHRRGEVARKGHLGDVQRRVLEEFDARGGKAIDRRAVAEHLDLRHGQHNAMWSLFRLGLLAQDTEFTSSITPDGAEALRRAREIDGHPPARGGDS